MNWTVELHKAGHDPIFVTAPHLGARIERVVARRVRSTFLELWEYLTNRVTEIFIEEYEPTQVSWPNHTCVAVFRSLRRSDELARVFDPKRLPA